STRVFIRACAPFVIVILRGLHQFVGVVFLQRSRNTAVSRRQYVLVGSAASSLAQTLTLCGFCFPQAVLLSRFSVPISAMRVVPVIIMARRNSCCQLCSRLVSAASPPAASAQAQGRP